MKIFFSLFKKNINIGLFAKLLFVLVLFELVIGGSGHFTELGPITLRMLFFLIAVISSILYYSFKKVIKRDVFIIIWSFTLLSIFGATIGFLNNAPIPLIIEDFKPLSFFYILLFFSISINKSDDIELISRVIKKGAIIIAVIYLFTISMLFIGKIDFLTFYANQERYGEVIFRNDTLFFYKGFLYLCIGFFFYLFTNGKFKFISLLFLYICIILTLTRGFILFTTILLIFYLLFINQNKLLKIFTIIIGFIITIIAIPFLIEAMGDRSNSDAIRYIQMEQVMSSINPISLIVGHGLGVGTEIRPIHMELSFLEIFHKQGLIGIVFWLCIYIHIFIMFFNIKDKRIKNQAYPFVLSVVFVILQSTTNPFMNNPIGLTMILITIVVLSKLLEQQKALE